MMQHFSTAEIKRYHRHFMLPEVGAEGQLKIKKGKVLVVGAGGLGSPVLLYLAAAGVGTIGIIDHDTVDISNLQRQIIHFTSDINQAKVFSAKEKITALNPEVTVETYTELLSSRNASELIGKYDFVVDATDSYSTKSLINDTCVRLKKAFSYGAIFQFSGQTMTYIPGCACYQCVFDSLPPNSIPAGLFGAVAGILGSIQAAETLKFLSGAGQLLTNRLLTFNARDMAFDIFHINRTDKCAVCGNSIN